MDAWDKVNETKKGPGRPALPWDIKWVNCLRTKVWYTFLESAGFNLKDIDLSFQLADEYDGQRIKRGYGAIDRQYRFWREGTVPVKKEVLKEVEAHVPGSLEVYAVGPDGAHLWLLYQQDTNYLTEALFFKDPLPIDKNHKQIDPFNSKKRISLFDILPEYEHGLPPDLVLDISSKSGLGTSYKPDSPWFKISFAMLSYCLRKKLSLEPQLPTDHKLLQEAISESVENAEKNILKTICKYKETIRASGIDPADLVYPFVHNLHVVRIDPLFYEFECEHNKRKDNPAWLDLEYTLENYK